ncbi:mucin-19-like [Paramacrobiotus metropolitanus]|uniref:mucin-19-like n=1 Tax=Paramacrobiotus metropolitanus TaxID=2943436 RepID=UPI0024458313|nr:mucin-19-like [Paramacrobiotus metropolitanus]
MSSGWGDPPSGDQSSAVSSDGGWGDSTGGSAVQSWGSNASMSTSDSGVNRSDNAGRNRSMGLTGEPCPDDRHGGFKLSVFCIAPSVDAERLKTVFGSCGTVKDAFVKDGEKGKFGFVTMETVAECEKAASELNGKDIDGSRLRISWARPRPGGSNGTPGARGGGSNCFKCQQPGHRANNCPGSGTAFSTLSASSTSDDSGWDSVPKPNPVPAEDSSGWGDSASTTAALPSTDNSTASGWGAPPSGDQATADSSGGWGDSAGGSAGQSWGSDSNASVSAGSVYRSDNAGRNRNMGLVGEPCPDDRHGGFKLSVFCIAASVDADRLRTVFGAYGTVKDAFVKDGEKGKFGFVTMEAVAECEKAASELSGKDIDGSRLRISWARPRPGGGNGAPGARGGGSNCFKCNQPGHRANNCPGAADSSSPSAKTDDAGWDSAPTSAPTENSSGWGESANATAAPSTDSMSSGWGAPPSGDQSAAVSSDGGWGEPTGGSVGQSWGSDSHTSTAGESSVNSSDIAGRNRSMGLTGEPCPDDRHGGFKLSVFCVAPSVDAERLKSVFGSCGTVKDTFVKDGEKGKFAFVTMETVAECEKAATELGGKDIDGSRLRISWARPRAGGANSTPGAGARGGGSNCFKCHQPGHRANNCPGNGAASSTPSAMFKPDDSGWDSAPKPSTDNDASGWGESAGGTAVSTAASSGWENSDNKSAAAGSGGGWDDSAPSGDSGWNNATSPSKSTNDWAKSKSNENSLDAEMSGLQEFLLMKKQKNMEEKARILEEIRQERVEMEKLKRERVIQAIQMERIKNSAPKLPPAPKSLRKSEMYPDLFSAEEREKAAREYGMSKRPRYLDREHLLFSGERSKEQIMADAEAFMGGVVTFRKRSLSPEDENDYKTPTARTRKRIPAANSGTGVVRSATHRGGKSKDESPEFSEPNSPPSDEDDEEYKPTSATAGRKRKSVSFDNSVKVFESAVNDLFKPDQPVRTTQSPADSSTGKTSGSKRKAPDSSGNTKKAFKVSVELVPPPEGARYATRSRKQPASNVVDLNSTPILDVIKRMSETSKQSK